MGKENALQAAWNELAGIHYVSAAPAGLAEDAPLIIALHGRGADAMDLSGLAAEVGAGKYRWIFPQGPRPVPLGGGAVGWAWYEIGEDATVVEAREQLVAFLAAALEESQTPAGKAALIGFSQGGAMTMHGGVSFREPLAALGIMSGHLPAA